MAKVSKLRFAAVRLSMRLPPPISPGLPSFPESQIPNPRQDIVRHIPPIWLALHVVAHAGKYPRLSSDVSRCAPNFTRWDDVIAFGTPELERAGRRLLNGGSGNQALTEREW
jgi:hypothetical protein